MEKKTDENLSHNLSTLPNELLHLCIEKAFYIGVAATSVPKDQRRQFFRNIILVNLTWFKAIEQLHRKTDSNKKTTHGIYQSRIRLKDIDAIHKLKAMLEKAKAQQAQLEELLRFKENERRLMETELKATDVQNMLLEANRNIKRLELELIHMRNEVEVDTKQLIEVKETANLEKDFKVMFEVAHAENITLKEETGIKDKEILQLKERAVSAEELTEQLRQQLNCCKDEALHQKQLLDRTFSENEKLHNEKKQLTDENELLKCEINQLKEQVSLQLKMIEEQKDDSGKSLERTTEGMYYLHNICDVRLSNFNDQIGFDLVL